MKVVLTKDLEGYGFFGDVIEVKNGFANNYLIPRGYAVPAAMLDMFKRCSGRKEGR